MIERPVSQRLPKVFLLKVGLLVLMITALYVQTGLCARKALVIGNADYPFGELKNPLNDAKDMTKVLKEIDFHVVTLLDAGKPAIAKTLAEFSEDLESEDVALFYYAGHALQINNENYLLGCNIEGEEVRIDDYSIKVTDLTNKMERSAMSIIILDACRTNPYSDYYISDNNVLTRSKRGIGIQLDPGLAPPKRAMGTFIAYSTGIGDVASDGYGENGLFTKYLLRYIKKPGFRLEDVFKRVRESVARESDGKQIPWDSSSITGVFHFVKPEDRVIRRKDKKIFTPAF